MTTFSYSYDFKILAKDLPHQHQPIIYGWWRNHTYLYIGLSRRGLQRLRSHDVLGVIESYLPNDELHFWKTSVDQLAAYERYLIEFFQPKYNLMFTSNFSTPPAAPPLLRPHSLEPGDVVWAQSQRFTVRKLFDIAFSYLTLSAPGLLVPITDSILSRLLPTSKPHEWRLE